MKDIIAILLGGFIGWVITWYYYRKDKRESKEKNLKQEKLIIKGSMI